MVGVGDESFINEDAVALPLRPTLEWSRNQVPETAFGDGRLGGQHAVEGVEIQRRLHSHGFRDKRAAEVARQFRIDRLGEEEPDMAAVARTRSLDMRLESALRCRLSERPDGVFPAVLVEIEDEQVRLRIVVEHVEPNDVAESFVSAFEVRNQRGVRNRRK